MLILFCLIRELAAQLYKGRIIILWATATWKEPQLWRSSEKEPFRTFWVSHFLFLQMVGA
jgi:hypothetical protein